MRKIKWSHPFFGYRNDEELVLNTPLVTTGKCLWFFCVSASG